MDIGNNQKIILSNQFSIEPLDDEESWVYDVSVEEVEQFFANNFLVHNSNYISIDALVAKKFPNGGSIKEITEWIASIYDSTIGKIISSSCADLQHYCNAPELRLHMVLEKIMCGMFFTDKKKRYATLLASKGKEVLEKPKLKETGLESVKSSTPLFARRFLKDVYFYLLTHFSDEGLDQLIKKQYNDFLKKPYDEIANVTSVNTGLEKLTDDEYYNDNFNKGTSSAIKACIIHNKYNKKKNYLIQPILQNGVKIKYLPLKSQNGISNQKDINIAYIGEFPNEWKNDQFLLDQIDLDSIWKDKYLVHVEDLLALFKMTCEGDIEDYEFIFD